MLYKSQLCKLGRVACGKVIRTNIEITKSNMSAKISTKHPELFHYTTFSSLDSILNEARIKRCLWATHFGYLNDGSEFKDFFTRRLPEIAKICIEPYVDKLCNVDKTQENIIKIRHGSKDEFVKFLVNDTCERLSYAMNHISEPYIISMCSTEDSYVSNNGLLSQWRAYGNDGGCAIVFRTSDFEELIKQERNEFDFVGLQMREVCYYNHLKSKYDNKELAESELAIKIKINDQLAGRESSPKEAMDALLRMGTSHKHWGFLEEKEVRLIGVLRKLERGEDEEISKPQPKIHFHMRGETPVPHLKLFEGKDLPIDRIIIGPHREQSKRREAVNKLLKSRGFSSKIDVVCSDIPYVGK